MVYCIQKWPKKGQNDTQKNTWPKFSLGAEIIPSSHVNNVSDPI